MGTADAKERVSLLEEELKLLLRVVGHYASQHVIVRRSNPDASLLCANVPPSRFNPQACMIRFPAGTMLRRVSEGVQLTETTISDSCPPRPSKLDLEATLICTVPPAQQPLPS